MEEKLSAYKWTALVPHSLALDRSLQKSVSSVEPVLTLGPASFPVLLRSAFPRSNKKAGVTVLTLRGYLGVKKKK